MSTERRSLRERCLQTISFEAVGLVLVTPLYSRVVGQEMRESFTMLAALSLVVTAWSAAFNTWFDEIERRTTGRVASDRPKQWRCVHALLHEATAVVVSCPVLVVCSELDWLSALGADVCLAAVYAAYAYGFHLAYDRWRPVAARPSERPDVVALESVPNRVRPASPRAAVSTHRPCRVGCAHDSLSTAPAPVLVR